MTRDDIIKMAQKAKLLPIDIGPTVDTKYMRRKRESLQNFAELVAEHTLSNIDPSKFMSYQEGYEAGVLNERERTKYDGIHTCSDQCQRPACVAVREAVQREREECAKVVEDYPHWIGLTAKAEISNAIRARGQQ
jgi:hypothetical protein